MLLWKIDRLRDGTKLYSLEPWWPVCQVYRLRDDSKFYCMGQASIGEKVLMAVIWVGGYPLATTLSDGMFVNALITSASAQ
jgi:hypothetical protein